MCIVTLSTHKINSVSTYDQEKKGATDSVKIAQQANSNDASQYLKETYAMKVVHEILSMVTEDVQGWNENHDKHR